VSYQDQLDRNAQLHKEWESIFDSYLSALSSMNITLNKKLDEQSLLRIREFDKALKALKEKYPDKFL